MPPSGDGHAPEVWLPSLTARSGDPPTTPAFLLGGTAASPARERCRNVPRGCITYPPSRGDGHGESDAGLGLVDGYKTRDGRGKTKEARAEKSG